MEQRHDAADHVLCIVSDEYLKAPYSTLPTQCRDLAGGGKKAGLRAICGCQVVSATEPD
jgi:hypothetical protein